MKFENVLQPPRELREL